MIPSGAPGFACLLGVRHCMSSLHACHRTFSFSLKPCSPFVDMQRTPLSVEVASQAWGTRARTERAARSILDGGERRTAIDGEMGRKRV